MRQRHGMMCGCSQRQKHGIRTKRRINRRHARTGHHKPRGSATEKPANIAKTARAGHENCLSWLPACGGAGMNHAPN
jgi:hypothetical protein